MRPASRIAPRFVIALAVAGVTMIGWVARSTLAQDGPKVSRPATPSETLPPAPDSGPLKLAEPPSEPSAPPQTTAVGDHGEPPAVAPNQAGPGDDDPEKNARAFVERNRQEAQAELKKLKDEAQRLRTRLGKVEAGIQRWDALLAALENSEKVATAKPAGSRTPPANKAPVALGADLP